VNITQQRVSWNPPLPGVKVIEIVEKKPPPPVQKW
jgi:hypothetical protein